MNEDIWKDFDALLWLRGKQDQYHGYEPGSQDNIRHQYFKAAADELERYRSKLDEYEHRAKLHMDRCQHDMERIVALEQQNEALASRLGALQKAIEADLSDAKAVCGGDGEGCETYRGYYDSAERRHRKCGTCPMDALFHVRAALNPLPTGDGER